jgi:hypothetical protein
MRTSLLGTVLGVVVVGTATAMPFCLVPTASEPTPAPRHCVHPNSDRSSCGGTEASSPEPADPMAVPVLGCEPGSSMAPFADVWISEC